MSKYRVLIVDDEEDVVELLGFRLKTKGCEVLEAYDGEEGLAVSKKEIPDLILLDIKLPKQDGIQVCLTLKQDPSTQKIPIILISASIGEIKKGEKIAKADGFLKKPFEPAELFKAISPYLKVNSGGV